MSGGEDGFLELLAVLMVIERNRQAFAEGVLRGCGGRALILQWEEQRRWQKVRQGSKRNVLLKAFIGIQLIYSVVFFVCFGSFVVCFLAVRLEVQALECLQAPFLQYRFGLLNVSVWSRAPKSEWHTIYLMSCQGLGSPFRAQSESIRHSCWERGKRLKRSIFFLKM